MIPKVIHFCWLSGDPFPEEIQRCLDTWKKHLSDYDIWLWDTNRFDINSTLWTKQAYEVRKYAFAADYIRLYALYNYGGIYLDSDVIMYKSFDDLLKLPYFIGQDYTGTFEAAVIGSEKGMDWIGTILERYKTRAFIQNDGSYDMLPLPIVFLNELEGKYNFIGLNHIMDYKRDNNIYLFHKDFFNSRNSIGVHQTKRSFCSHNYAGSWAVNTNSFKNRVKRLLPNFIMEMVYKISHNTFRKAHIHRYDPLYRAKKFVSKKTIL